MIEKVVLFDVENALIKEAKDVSRYYYEAIRSTYGLSIDNINLAEYEGSTVQETLINILTKQGLSRDEIYRKHELFLEELPYAHYNVAGHDRAVLTDGAKDLLNRLRSKNRYVIGAASGQLERILKNLFERAGLDYDSYFRFGCYGNENEHLSKIIDSAVRKAENEFGVGKHHITFISNTKAHINAAHALGIHVVGVITDQYSKRDLEFLGIVHVVKNLRDCGRYLK